MSNPVKPSEDTVLWAKAERVADDNTMNHLHPIPTAPLGEESYVTAMSNAETPLISSTTTTTTLIVNQSLGRYPCEIVCPFCQQETITRTRDVMGWLSLFFVVLMCFVCCPLAWVPFCCPSCKVTDHYCRQCNRRICRVEPCSTP